MKASKFKFIDSYKGLDIYRMSDGKFEIVHDEDDTFEGDKFDSPEAAKKAIDDRLESLIT